MLLRGSVTGVAMAHAHAGCVQRIPTIHMQNQLLTESYPTSRLERVINPIRTTVGLRFLNVRNGRVDRFGMTAIYCNKRSRNIFIVSDDVLTICV